MHLYPGEEIIFKGKQEFLNIRKEVFNTMEISFAVCNSKCDRNFRPLSCRIYPLIPYLDHNNVISIIEDPRAKYTCPLLFNMDEIKMDKLFIRKVKKIFQLLAQDMEINAYINTLSNVLNEYSRFISLKLP